MAKPNQWLEFLYQALASPLGVVIAVSDAQKALQRLYQARAAAQDEALAGLQFRRSPIAPDTEIWIIKAKPDGAQDQNPAGETEEPSSVHGRLGKA